MNDADYDLVDLDEEKFQRIVNDRVFDSQPYRLKQILAARRQKQKAKKYQDLKSAITPEVKPTAEPVEMQAEPEVQEIEQPTRSFSERVKDVMSKRALADSISAGIDRKSANKFQTIESLSDEDKEKEFEEKLRNFRKQRQGY